MSQYLKYLLNRAGCHTFENIWILKVDRDWINSQIYDEFRVVFPEARVSLQKDLKDDAVGLIVLPYSGAFPIQEISTILLNPEVLKDSSSWVMFYGVQGRKIEVMRLSEVEGFQKKCLKVSFFPSIIRTLHLDRLVRQVQRLYLRL